MARITKPLSQTEVKAARPKEKEYTLRDGDGLFLRIKPNGAKLWLFDYYRPITKKRTVMGFGPYPELSLAEARRKRDEAKSLLAQNIDPQEHRQQVHNQELAQTSHTFLAIAERWMEVKRPSVTQSYANDIWRSFELYILPELGPLPIASVKAQTAIKAITPVAAAGKLETVRRLVQRVNEVMTFAVNFGLIDANPCSGISKVFEKPAKQHMPTLEPERLPELMIALSTANIKRTTRCLIEWSLHTLVRPSEAAGARWDEIDFDAMLWRIPENRMKKRRAHIIPLTEQSLALLEVMRPISGQREHIFPGDRNPTEACNSQTANAALKRMGFAGQLVAHGLRSLGSTTLNAQGFDGDVIEAALAHADRDEVRRAYNRTNYLERRKPLMVWWSNHIEQAARGNLSLAAGVKKLQTAK